MSECLRRLLRNARQVETCCIWEWTVLPGLLYVYVGLSDVYYVEALLDGRVCRWPRPRVSLRRLYR